MVEFNNIMLYQATFEAALIRQDNASTFNSGGQINLSDQYSEKYSVYVNKKCPVMAKTIRSKPSAILSTTAEIQIKNDTEKRGIYFLECGLCPIAGKCLARNNFPADKIPGPNREDFWNVYNKAE